MRTISMKFPFRTYFAQDLCNLIPMRRSGWVCFWDGDASAAFTSTKHKQLLPQMPNQALMMPEPASPLQVRVCVCARVRAHERVGSAHMQRAYETTWWSRFWPPPKQIVRWPLYVYIAGAIGPSFSDSRFGLPQIKIPFFHAASKRGAHLPASGHFPGTAFTDIMPAQPHCYLHYPRSHPTPPRSSVKGSQHQ